MIQREELKILRERVNWLRGIATVETLPVFEKEPLYYIKNNGDGTVNVYRIENPPICIVE